jgi:hypothetical protein
MTITEAAAVIEILRSPVHVMSKSSAGVIGTIAHSAAALMRWCNAASRAEDCYVCLNPSSSVGRVKPTIEEITEFKFWMLDLDPTTEPRNDAIYAVDILCNALQTAFGFIPFFWFVDSGRGRQFWIPVEPNTLYVDDAQRLIKGVTQYLTEITPDLRTHGYRIDSACAEVSHMARLPGSINTKTGLTATILRGWGAQMLTVADMQPFAAPAPTPTEPINPTIYESKAGLLLLFNSLTWRNRAFIMEGADAELVSRHSRFFACAKQMHELSCPPDMALGLLKEAAHKCRPSLLRTDPGFVERTWRSIWKS